MNNQNDNQNYEFLRLTETLQAAIVLAGGKKIDQDELFEMSLIDLISLINPNGVKLLVEFEGKIRK